MPFWRHISPDCCRFFFLIRNRSLRIGSHPPDLRHVSGRISSDFWPAAASVHRSHISLPKSVLGQICCFLRLLRSASGNARPGFLAALAEILRTADQFCPETLLTIARTTAANVVELSPPGCRIDKESPI